jgi:cell division protein FtsL
MKAKVDLLQEKQIRVLFYLVATMGALTTLAVFYQNRKMRKEKLPLIKMEEELKQLQLEKLRSEKSKGTF